MNISGTPYTSLWHEPLSDRIFYIDQTRLPWELVIREMTSFEEGVRAIKDMEVRGAPLIGVAAAFALYLGLREEGHKAQGTRHKAQGARHKVVEEMCAELMATRPTAVNLRKALDYMTDDRRPMTEGRPQTEGRPMTDDRRPMTDGRPMTEDRRPQNEKWPREEPHHTSPPLNHTSLYLNYTSPHLNHHSPFLQRAIALREAEILRSRAIGEHGLRLIEEEAAKKGGEVVNILTHCNAGWLATIDYGTALAPVYMAHDKGIKVHVWVDETRPRNQGSKLTAYELSQHGVPCTVIVDNAGGHLMQRGEVDLCIVGADRITRNGDAANKIGTYLKALAAYDNHIPFYVAAPSSTFDEDMETGAEIEIEERGAEEVRGGEVPVGARGARPSPPAHGVRPSPPVCPFPGVPDGVAVRNPGFDVTPARLITAFISEDGVRSPVITGQGTEPGL